MIAVLVPGTVFRSSRYRRVFEVLMGFVSKLYSTGYIVLKENKKISYETKGYRIWFRFKKNKIIIEYYKPSRKDYDLWYVNQYLGRIVAGRYSRFLFYIAAIASLAIVSWNPGYANIAVLIVGVFIVLDYIVHVYYNWSLIRLHQEAYKRDLAYKNYYDKVRDEILSLIEGGGEEQLRTIVFLEKTWFKKEGKSELILSRHPL